jgi:hypothetical protein
MTRPNDFTSSHTIDRDSRTYEADCATANAEAPRKRVTWVCARQYLCVDKVRSRHDSI